MKLLILSDIHGETGRLADVLWAERGVDAILFLGDGLRDMQSAPLAAPRPLLYAVRGNCDFVYDEPAEGLAPFGGLLIFYTHGHLYGVKSSAQRLAEAAAARGADIAIFGHTHEPFDEVVNGVHLFNPGSLAYSRADGPSYGLLEITDQKPVFTLRRLKL